MRVRLPAVAGQFYPADADACRDQADRCLSASTPLSEPASVLGGIVPHAGWMCSGAVAAGVLRSLASNPDLQTVVLFGAVHRPRSRRASVFASGAWVTPLGTVDVDTELARAAIDASPLLVDDPGAHEAEHSLEVQLPLLQRVAPAVRILPILVPPTTSAPDVGRVVAAEAARLGRRIAFAGSSDLTHYGPRYGFVPKGVGEEGLRWARDVNDRRIIELALAMESAKVVPEAMSHQNACGAGAIAATLEASRIAGARSGRLLCHTTSNEVLRDRYGDMDDAVGYAGVLLER